MKDVDYIKSKLKHMKNIGINADINPMTGAARPDWAKSESLERHDTHARNAKRKAERANIFYKEGD